MVYTNKQLNGPERSLKVIFFLMKQLILVKCECSLLMFHFMTGAHHPMQVCHVLSFYIFYFERIYLSECLHLQP